MRSILEKALIALLNEDKAKADALFHDFILERSRQIHESLRQGEDFVLDESWEQELAIDEMFTEADLEDVTPDGDYDPRIDTGVWMKTPHGSFCVVDSDEEAAKLVQHGWVETDEEEAKNESSIFDYEGLMIYSTAEEALASEGLAEEAEEAEEVSSEASEETIEDRVDDIEAELQRLSAEFSELVGDDEGEAEEVTEATIEVTDGDTVVHIDTEEASEGAVSDSMASDDFSDEEFAQLGESILDELERVDVKGDVEGMTSGEKVAVDTTSRVTSKPSDKRVAGEPIRIKSEKRSGYDREAAPKSDTFKARRNTLKSATDDLKTSSKEGDASAELNKLGDDKTAQAGLFDKKI